VACTDLLRDRGTKKGTKHCFVVVVVFILSFLGILRKYVDTIKMHNTSNENRERMILLNIIYFTKQNSDNQEGNYGRFFF